MDVSKISPQEQFIKQEAIDHAKTIRTRIANSILETSGGATEEAPMVLFMAGAPGAGKTEISTAFSSAINHKRKPKVVRIDPDEFRSQFPAYSGDNSHLFQIPVIKIVEKVVDKLLQKKYSFILDGTFSSYIVAKRNVERSLNKNYYITITYVYQPPEVSWKFVCAREKAEGRRIHKHIFAEQYLKSIETVNLIKKEFGDQVQLDIIIKNYNQPDESRFLLNEKIIGENSSPIYTFEQLMRIL